MLFRHFASLVSPALACSVALLVLGCGPSCPFPDPYPDGASCLDTCATDNARSRAECEAICSSDECSAEPTRAAALPLSVGLAVYTVTAQNAPATSTACNDPASGAWCKCGTDYTDAAARCNTLTETLLVRVPALGCEAATATLSYQVSTWQGATSVDVRRILRPVADPTMGVAGLCASTAMASWYRSGPEAWTLPGGKGDGTDRSVASVTKALASAGVRTETFDVLSLVGGCSAGCVLGQFNDGPHVQVLAGSASLVYTCAGPAAVCGDGVTEGSEACDDGGVTAGDGCSALCALEPGWTCSGAPSACNTVCGDGITAGSEECDDGNASNADACSAACETQVCSCQ